MSFYIKRTNITADSDVTIIGKRFMCGADAKPFDTIKSAKSAMLRQKKQDEEYCPECIIKYEITKKETPDAENI